MKVVNQENKKLSAEEHKRRKWKEQTKNNQIKCGK